MLQDLQRKKLSVVLAIISLTIIFSLFSLNIGINNRVIALVNNDRIYINDIKAELLEIFPGSNSDSFQIERLPKNVLEFVAKEVYIKNNIYKDARRYMVHQDRNVENKIDRYSRKIIREHFVEMVLKKKVTKQSAREKYLEFSDEIKEDKEFKISHILVKTLYQAKKVVVRIKEGESFTSLAQKYSLDRKSRRKKGSLGYFKEDKIQKEFSAIVLNMRKGAISAPIKTKRGWHVVQLSDVRFPRLEEFEKIEEKIIEALKKEAIKKIFSDIVKNAKVEILIDHS